MGSIRRARMLSCFSCVQLFVILCTIAHQAPLSMGFSRQEIWSGLPFPSPGESFHPRDGNSLSLGLLHWPGGFFTTSTTWEAQEASECNTKSHHLAASHPKGLSLSLTSTTVGVLRSAVPSSNSFIYPRKNQVIKPLREKKRKKGL